MTTQIGLSAQLQGSLTILAMLVGVALAWQGLGAIRWEIFVREPRSGPARLLRLLLAILIGGGLAGFIVQYATAAALLHG